MLCLVARSWVIYFYSSEKYMELDIVYVQIIEGLSFLQLLQKAELHLNLSQVFVGVQSNYSQTYLIHFHPNLKLLLL